MARSFITTLPRETIVRICRVLLTPPNVSDPPTQSSLAALSVTCRCLSDPALDVLWYTVESLVQLVLYTLPTDLYAVVPAADTRTWLLVDYRLEALRDPLPADFDRFSTYASRVKMFSYEYGVRPFFEYQISSDLWARLLRYGPKPLLPNIRSLDHRETDYEYRREHGPDRGPVYLSEVLYGPQLKDVEIDYGGWPPDEHRPNELVKALSHASPRVETLTLSDGMSYRNVTTTRVKTPLLSCPETGWLHCLVKLDACFVHVTPPALVGLASLPSLSDLQLHVDPAHYDWDSLPHGGRGPFFPALTALELYRIHFEWSVALIRTVTSSSLGRMTLADGEDEDEAASDILLKALCTSLREHPSRSTLQDLGIHTGKTFQAVTPPKVYRSEHIAPLLSLSMLRCLSIRGNCQVIVDDYMLNHISWAWPNVEALKLYFCCPSDGQGLSYPMPNPEDADHPRATLDGVLLLGWYCPQLTALELAVDMRWIPDFDPWSSPWPPVSLHTGYAPSLKSFNYNGSVFEKDTATAKLPLATLLTLVFPHLEEIRGPYEREWPTMTEIYQRFQRIRWHERRLLSRRTRLQTPEL